MQLSVAVGRHVKLVGLVSIIVLAVVIAGVGQECYDDDDGDDEDDEDVDDSENDEAGGDCIEKNGRNKNGALRRVNLPGVIFLMLMVIEKTIH